jgi:UDP-glucose 4-epimerase
MMTMDTEINIGTGDETSTNRLVDIVRSLLDYQGKSCHIKSRSIDQIQRRALDNNRASALLGWHPTINIVEGIRRTIEWQTKNYIL